MQKFRFWSRNILALVLGIIGFSFASAVPQIPGIGFWQTRVLYAIIGVSLGFLIFAQISTWIVTTSTRLFSKLMLRIASEVINQFTHLTSSGISFLNPNPDRNSERLKLSHSVILDTSAIIDGRVLDVAKSGFLSGIVLVPNFVLTELQQVADSGDALKRSRGRKGFEIIESLKKLSSIKVDVWDKPIAGKGVDDQLVRLAKAIKGRILTCDYNLNKVATVSGIRVLNINELANALKMVAIPGEKLSVKIIHPGKDKEQGVGYLEDGTMVVVSGASNKVGEMIETEVTRVLQAPTGRMIFASLIES